MNEEGNAPTRLVLDFAAQELTCQNITKAGEDLANLIGLETTDLALLKIDLRKIESDVEMRIRNSGVKVTEGYVTSTVDGDNDVVAMRKKVAKLEGKLAGIKASIENVDRGYGLFKTWMQGQRPIGLQDR